MDTEGVFAPETAAAAHERFQSFESAANTALRTLGRELGMGTDEYTERMTEDVRLATQEAMFASLLEVHVGTRSEYEMWLDDHEFEAVEVGTESVDNVVWHAPPFAERAIAATFQSEREAAVGTLRTQAFGRLYRDVVSATPDASEDTDD
ncbi:DUF5809 family protein [Halovenus marina]|uniref:DUF5809 family protein n=1 Tax=Halovenus marina TaxID=3396621 RepID=UPI003F57F62B